MINKKPKKVWEAARIHYKNKVDECMKCRDELIDKECPKDLYQENKNLLSIFSNRLRFIDSVLECYED